jgi:hypothetical protein
MRCIRSYADQVDFTLVSMKRGVCAGCAVSDRTPIRAIIGRYEIPAAMMNSVMAIAMTTLIREPGEAVAETAFLLCILTFLDDIVNFLQPNELFGYRLRSGAGSLSDRRILIL